MEEDERPKTKRMADRTATMPAMTGPKTMTNKGAPITGTTRTRRTKLASVV